MNEAFLDGDGADDPRADWLLRHEPWLKVLARLGIDSHFQGKFSASDAVQQTLAAAWRDWSNCRAANDQQRLVWLRKILANQLGQLARHYSAAQRRDVRREVSLECSLAESSKRLERFLAADQRSPSGEAAAHEEQARLAEVLERLPADYRDVLVLRNLQELPFEEVANRLDRSPGAVRMLWVRALARLRDELLR